MNLTIAIITALSMLVGNAFFVGAEFSLISARRSTVELLALKGSVAAKITLGAMEKVALMIAGAQLGITVCSLVFGAIGEPIMEQLLEQPFHSLGFSAELITPISLIFTITIMVFLHVVIGEMIPKNLALTAPAKMALYLIPPLVFFVRVLKPIIIAIDKVSGGVLKLAGFRPKQEITSSFSRDEVAGIIKESLREGLLSISEEQLLSGSLHLDDASLESVIIPFNQVVYTSDKPTPSEIENLISKTGFSRFPIMGKNQQIKNYIHLKDILRLSDDEFEKPLPSKLFRSLVIVKSTSTLREAMMIMQKSGAHLAKVIDPADVVVGIIALEDVIEKLIGEIIDDTWK